MLGTDANPGIVDHASARSAVMARSDTVSVLQDRPVRRALNDYMKSMGIRGGPTNLAIFVEAIRRDATISASKNRGIKLEKDSVKHWWNNGGCSLNDPTVRRLCHQKEVNSRVLRARGVSAPENVVFAPDQARRAWAWAKPILPVVVKPFNAAQGRGVHTQLNNRTAFLKAFNSVSEEFGDVLVEEQLIGTEHRVFVVGKEVRAVLRQIPANVVGDGHSSIASLIRDKNQTATHPHKPISLGAVELAALKDLDLTPESVPEEGRTVLLRKNTNLSTGGDSIDATDELTAAEAEFVISAARAWPGLGCAGLDVMLPRTPNAGPPAIIEINISPGISAHLVPRVGQPRNVAAAILDTMFP